MLYELRIYKIAKGQIDAVLNLFEQTNLNNFERVGTEVCGMWTSVDDNNNFYYLLKFDDEADKEAKWEAFYASEDWQADIGKFQELGEVILQYDSYLMESVPFFENKC